MDLTFIMNRLENNYYSNKYSVVADMRLIADNCVKYNGEIDSLSDLSRNMYETFRDLVLTNEELTWFLDYDKPLMSVPRTLNNTRNHANVRSVSIRSERQLLVRAPTSARASNTRRSFRQPNQTQSRASQRLTSLESLPQPSDPANRQTHSLRIRIRNPPDISRESTRDMLNESDQQHRNSELLTTNAHRSLRRRQSRLGIEQESQSLGRARSFASNSSHTPQVANERRRTTNDGSVEILPVSSEQVPSHRTSSRLRNTQPFVPNVSLPASNQIVVNSARTSHRRTCQREGNRITNDESNNRIQGKDSLAELDPGHSKDDDDDEDFCDEDETDVDESNNDSEKDDQRPRRRLHRDRHTKRTTHQREDSDDGSDENEPHRGKRYSTRRASQFATSSTSTDRGSMPRRNITRYSNINTENATVGVVESSAEGTDHDENNQQRITRNFRKKPTLTNDGGSGGATQRLVQQSSLSSLKPNKRNRRDTTSSSPERKRRATAVHKSYQDPDSDEFSEVVSEAVDDEDDEEEDGNDDDDDELDDDHNARIPVQRQRLSRDSILVENIQGETTNMQQQQQMGCSSDQQTQPSVLKKINIPQHWPEIKSRFIPQIAKSIIAQLVRKENMHTVCTW